MRGGRKPYRELPPTERARTLDHEDALIEAAEDAIRDGWHPYERHEVIYANARRLGVWVWPALAERIARTARDGAVSPSYVR